MASDMFMIEIAAWEVRFSSDHLQTAELGSIVKFLNFQPFEFFHGISPCDISSSHSFYHIGRSKTAIFRCDPELLQVLIKKIPLHIVFARWPRSDFNATCEQNCEVIGITTVGLSTVAESLTAGASENACLNGASGSFVIRNLTGQSIGKIQMKIRLSSLPLSNTVKSNFGSTMMEEKDCLESDFCIPSSYKPATVACETKDECTQVCASELHQCKPQSCQTNMRTQPDIGRRKQSISHQGQHPGHHFHHWLLEEEPIQYDNRSDMAVFQPSPIYFYNTTQPGQENCQTLSKSRNTPVSPVLSSSPDRYIDPPVHTHESDIPLLRSLLKELKHLKSMTPAASDHRKLDLDELDVVKQLLFSTLRQSNETNTKPIPTPTSVPPEQLRKQPKKSGEFRADSRRTRISHLAVPKTRHSEPGLLVPKNCSWLRSTPIYQGPQRSKLSPRPNHTHLLRVEKYKRLPETQDSRGKHPLRGRPQTSVTSARGNGPSEIHQNTVQPRGSTIEEANVPLNHSFKTHQHPPSANTCALDNDPFRVSIVPLQPVVNGQAMKSGEPVTLTSSLRSGQAVDHSRSTDALATGDLSSDNPIASFVTRQPLPSTRSPQVSVVQAMLRANSSDSLSGIDASVQQLRLSTQTPQSLSSSDQNAPEWKEMDNEFLGVETPERVSCTSPGASDSQSATVYSEDYEDPEVDEPTNLSNYEITPLQVAFNGKTSTQQNEDAVVGSPKRPDHSTTFDTANSVIFSTELQPQHLVDMCPVNTHGTGQREQGIGMKIRTGTQASKLTSHMYPNTEQEDNIDLHEIEAMRSRGSLDFVLGGCSMP